MAHPVTSPEQFKGKSPEISDYPDRLSDTTVRMGKRNWEESASDAPHWKSGTRPWTCQAGPGPAAAFPSPLATPCAGGFCNEQGRARDSGRQVEVTGGSGHLPAGAPALEEEGPAGTCPRVAERLATCCTQRWRTALRSSPGGPCGAVLQKLTVLAQILFRNQGRHQHGAACASQATNRRC